jgi:phenylpyruvate tautomerase PptA (4-oxalocrotonate tautomerase family)
MPLVRIELRRGKSSAYKKAICDGIYRAMIDTFAVPQEDRFMIVTEHDDDGLIYSNNYLDIARSEDFVIIQITANDTRSLDQKKALFARIAALLTENPGVRKEEVFINLVEVKKENWSFGNGIAQYA